MDLAAFRDLRLRGGCVLPRIESLRAVRRLRDECLSDARRTRRCLSLQPESNAGDVRVLMPKGSMSPQIQIDLVKLAEGGRLLRLSERESRLCIEKHLDRGLAVVALKERWLRIFRDLLARETTTSGV